MRTGGRVLRFLGALALVWFAVAPFSVASAGPASAGPPAGRSGVIAPGPATGAAGLRLLDQSPFVTDASTWHLQLQVTAPSPATEIEVLVDARLSTRSAFDSDLKGPVHASSIYHFGPEPLSGLAADPAGGVDIDVPVDPTGGSSGAVAAFEPDTSASAVYPVQIELLNSSGNPTGTPLTTFLVYASPSVVAGLAPGAPDSGFPRLDVALDVPVAVSPRVSRTGALQRLGSAASGSLSAEVAAVAGHSGIPVTIAASPQTVDELTMGGSDADRQTVNRLTALVAAGDELAPEPYAASSLGSLLAGGLTGEATDQLIAGAQALQSDLGHAPAAGTMTLDEPVDEAMLGAATGVGINQFVLPAPALLSTSGSSTDPTPPAAPLTLERKGAPSVRAIGIDPGLTAHFDPTSNPVLAANQLLAELAVIQLETPSEHRGVVVVPPAGWNASPAFLETVLTGLDNNPLLDPVTTSGLFSGVPAAGSTSDPTTRTLGASRITGPTSAEAAKIRSARSAVTAVGQLHPDNPVPAATLRRQLLTAESTALPDRVRKAGIAGVIAVLGSLRDNITLSDASVTLTARNGDLPVTVVARGDGIGARVRLRLSSEKLAFKRFQPPGGSCESPSYDLEICQLTLAAEATTLKVPVLARASGVFSIDVGLATPDGTVGLDDQRETVRSTAFSGVGVVLIVAAALGLAFWWIRNLRHGRRSRNLVPADTDLDDEEMSGTGETIDVGRGDPPPPSMPWLDDDPVIAEFFANPPPDYPPPPEERRPSRGSHP